MESKKIVVRFKQSGEHFPVRVSSTTTIKDIIKYVCEQSIISAKIDYNNYYLVLLNNQDILDEDRIFEEIKPLQIENPDYQLCMKSTRHGTSVNFLQEYLRKNPTGIIVEPQIPPDDTASSTETESNDSSMSSIIEDAVTNQPATTLSASQFDTEKKPTSILPLNTSNLLQNNAASELPQSSTVSNTQFAKFCGISSHKDEESKPSDTTNLESNMNNPCPMASLYVQPTQEELGFSKSKAVSTDDCSSSSRPKTLASTYQHFTSKVREIGVKTTRDPVIRRDISETFNEINILLCGAPRVGKSTLINAICEKQLAKTSAGLGACTNRISSYFLKGNIEIDSGEINYRYNFWDTPGIEKWTQEDIHKTLEGIKKKPKSDILCMIYCASPGSYANIGELERLLNECMNQHIFCALVCTNKWAGTDEQLDAVMGDFQRLLESYHVKTSEANGVIVFGNMGLCTAVNSETFEIKRANIMHEQSGIDELILGIMESLDDEKVVQWCMLAFENKRFWKNVHSFPKQLKAVWKKLLRPNIT